MKKIIALMLTLALCLSFAGCASQPESQSESTAPETTESEVTESEVTESETAESESEAVQVAADADFVVYFNDIVIRVAPGTSGSALKAAGALENIIAWSEDKKPDSEVVKASVKEYLATSEFGLEAVDAFDMIKAAADAVRNGGGEEFFEDTEHVAAQLNGDAGKTVDAIFDAVSEFMSEQ